MLSWRRITVFDSRYQKKKPFHSKQVLRSTGLQPFHLERLRTRGNREDGNPPLQVTITRIAEKIKQQATRTVRRGIPQKPASQQRRESSTVPWATAQRRNSHELIGRVQTPNTRLPKIGLISKGQCERTLHGNMHQGIHERLYRMGCAVAYCWGTRFRIRRAVPSKAAFTFPVRFYLRRRDP